MKRRTILSVFAVLLAACGSSAARPAATGGTQSSSAAGGVVCGPSAAKTLAASSQARVYVRGRYAYACVRGAKRSRLLGQSSACLGRRPLISPVVVKGVLAAYGAETCGIDTGTAAVVVRRLSDGAVLAQQRASTAVVGPESHVRVTALVLERDGDVAWISVASAIMSGRHATQVQAFDQRGARLLDAGNAIDPAHLRLHGAKVSWKDGTAVRSATLG